MTATLGHHILGYAVEYGVQQRWRCVLHPEDHLVDYVVKHSPNAQAAGEEGYKIGVGEYFERGFLDTEQVLGVMRNLGHSDRASVLEFASGYGRMTRHIRLPNLVAADIHPEAVGFLRDQFGVDAIQSALDPANFNPGRTFDFIFAMSFFSHIPDRSFGPWIARLYSLLNPGGHLLFTTIGAGAADNPLLASRMPTDGSYDFSTFTDQPDVEQSTYGTMVATPRYVINKVGEFTLGHIISNTVRQWWHFQDEWIVEAPGRARGWARGVKRALKERRLGA